MQDRTQKIAGALTVAAQLFENYEVTADKVKALSAFFRDVDTALLVAALGMTIREPNRSFFPTPGEIQASITKLQRRKKFTPEQIFGQLREFARRGLPEARVYERLKAIGDPEAVQALRVITFEAIRSTPSNEMQFLQRRFTDAYNAVERRSLESNAIALTESRSAKFDRIAATTASQIGSV